ncbi:hypothetical protein ACGFZP_09910 [Kitasatospora sp. NPDC048239]|uniref:hypothetical protein n=1 Tax=Kitasatospora sp. NPDC048239 TaxID=3364046 RepID=UPI003711515B
MQVWQQHPGEPAGPIGVREALTDQAAAAEHCERLLRDTLGAVRPALAWRYGVPGAGARLPAPGAGPGDGDVHWYVTRSRHITTIISAARRRALLGAVEQHWRRRGRVVVTVAAGPPGVSAVTRDGYRLALGFGPWGNAWLTAASPGVLHSEQLPYPLGTPGVPGVSGVSEEPAADVAPVPEVRCPFWTALD